MELNIKEGIAALLLSGVWAVAASAGEVYRWVDENGEVHYSETLPPDFSDRGHDVLNEQGLVVDEDLSLTPDPPEEVPEEHQLKELPRDASGLPRPKQLYSEAEMQARMDNFLMLRYDSEQEIVDAMNVEIKQLAYDQRLLETTRQSIEVAYEGQLKRAANMQRAGKQVTPATVKEINELQANLSDNAQDLDGLKAREENIRVDFQKQLERYRFLVETWEEES